MSTSSVRPVCLLLTRPKLDLSWPKSRAKTWEKWTLLRAFTRAQLRLGEQMYQAGIDDGELCDQIAALDAKIQQTEAGGRQCPGLHKEKDRLLRLLADAALEEDAPLPGAEAEFRQARTVLAALMKG